MLPMQLLGLTRETFRVSLSMYKIFNLSLNWKAILKEILIKKASSLAIAYDYNTQEVRDFALYLFMFLPSSLGLLLI